MAPRPPKNPDEKPVKAAKPAKAATQPKTAAAKPSKPALKVVEPPTEASPGGPLKVKQLIDQVAAATGLKKPEAKKAVEATLSALGTALAAKTNLVVPPLGKLRVAKASAGILTVKLRLADAPRAAGLALADDGEDD
jgi:hypothetical protein